MTIDELADRMLLWLVEQGATEVENVEMDVWGRERGLPPGWATGEAVLGCFLDGVPVSISISVTQGAL